MLLSSRCYMEALPWRTLSGWDRCCSKTCRYLSALSRCGSCWCSPVPSEMQAFELSPDHRLDGLSSLWSGGHSTHGFAWWSFNLHQCAHQAVFSGFWESSWARALISMTEGPKSSGIQQWCLSLSVTHRDFLLYLLWNLLNVIGRKDF